MENEDTESAAGSGKDAEHIGDEARSRGVSAEQGVPEKEPETIGEALKKYYEEQLTHADRVRTETGRRALLLQVLANHSMSLN